MVMQSNKEDMHVTRQQSQPEQTPRNDSSRASTPPAKDLLGLQLSLLEQFLNENFRVTVERGQRVIQLNNGRQDTISISLDEPTKPHIYRVTVNEKQFSLAAGEFYHFVNRYQLGTPEARDRVIVTYEGKPIEQYTTYDTGPGLLFALVVNRLGYQPQSAEHRSARDQKLWTTIVKQIPPDTDKVEVKNLVAKPPELEKIIRHSVSVNDASGTIVELPDGRLGVATSAHVLTSRLDDPRGEFGTVTVDGKKYTARAVYPSSPREAVYSPHDYAYLIFSNEDAQELKNKGLTGIPLIADNALDRFSRVISLGYAADEQSKTSRFLLRVGQIYTQTTEGPSKAELSAQQYDGEEMLRVRGPQGMWTTSSEGVGGESGGGLFYFNSQLGRFELIGVHVTADARASVVQGRILVPPAIGFHALVDQNRVIELLKSR